LSEVDVAQINSRVELLRKNPLARRDFFEHWQGVNSPCDGA
jgi:hypothetical protein